MSLKSKLYLNLIRINKLIVKAMLGNITKTKNKVGTT